MFAISKNSDDSQILAATLWAEARGEPYEGIQWVAHVIKNRKNKSGTSYRDVCLAPWQFECWNNRSEIMIDDTETFKKCKEIAVQVMNSSSDPTGGCDHYNNPDKEGYPNWTNNCTRDKKIGGHQFYKAKF